MTELEMPAAKSELLAEITARLSQVPGMAAVVLGGSYASGAQHAASDLDIGLYYLDSAPFQITAVRQVAQAISTGSPTVTGFYEWGPWVNGGAWIQTRAGKVDFLYRSLEQVERTLLEAHQGIQRHDYDQQPTFGFYSVAYLAETRICRPLYDPQGKIAHLKNLVENYPPRLKQQIILDCLWSGEFTLLHARDFAAAGDVYNTAGCLARAASVLTQVLFAYNETYFISDKKVMAKIAAFPLKPAGYVERLEMLLAHPGRSAAELLAAVAGLEAEWQAVAALAPRAGTDYQPKFILSPKE